MRYIVSRYSSPGEWHIAECADDEAPEDEAAVATFATFSEAKAWLIDQTFAWYDGFRDDMREVRSLRKSDVRTADPA